MVPAFLGSCNLPKKTSPRCEFIWSTYFMITHVNIKVGKLWKTWNSHSQCKKSPVARDLPIAIAKPVGASFWLDFNFVEGTTKLTTRIMVVSHFWQLQCTRNLHRRWQPSTTQWPARPHGTAPTFCRQASPTHQGCTVSVLMPKVVSDQMKYARLGLSFFCLSSPDYHSLFLSVAHLGW